MNEWIAGGWGNQIIMYNNRNVSFSEQSKYHVNKYVITIVTEPSIHPCRHRIITSQHRTVLSLPPFIPISYHTTPCLSIARWNPIGGTWINCRAIEWRKSGGALTLNLSQFIIISCSRCIYVHRVLCTTQCGNRYNCHNYEIMKKIPATESNSGTHCVRTSVKLQA